MVFLLLPMLDRPILLVADVVTADEIVQAVETIGNVSSSATN